MSPSSPKVASPSSSPPTVSYRLPRTRSRPHLSPRASLESIVEESQVQDGHDSSSARGSSSSLSVIVKIPSSPALDRVKGEWAEAERSPASAGTDARRRSFKSQSWNGKSGISMGKGMRDVCGICFEAPVKPNKTRCCGQMFCFQHLSDWLSASGSDGRCPTCRVHLSIETDTICLHTPAKVALRMTPKRRATVPGIVTPRTRRPSLLIPQPPHSHTHSLSSSSSSSSSTSTAPDSSDGWSSSSESESDHRRRRRSSTVVVPLPQYESMTDLVSGLVPLREFGSLLSLVGCALVVGTLLS
ncbi:hypothetical protein BV25DRAFT_1918424 [Artomyces pyxidatus]|uniref:Uncharacterized protein n=1 Tax=Artomyces pyxidatus TaxID=48021 RepID=A0ACB8ST74_9AGAM|nr:hypothetical protein BV25DRAFT_1918424 [Artomyces pyxidatus]